jgi:hypothetical protein
MQVFKAHGMVQARIIDTASETFSAIRTVSVQSLIFIAFQTLNACFSGTFGLT